MSIVNKNMTKSIFLESDMAAILNFVNKKFSPGEPLVLPMVFMIRRFNLAWNNQKTSVMSQNMVPWKKPIL